MIFVDDPTPSPPYASSAKQSLPWRLNQSPHHKHPAAFLHWCDFTPKSTSSDTAPQMPLRTPGLATPDMEKTPHAGVNWKATSDQPSNDAGVKDPKGLDSQLWHACAGGMVQLPCLGTQVVYFPQGHGEQAATLPEFPCSLAPSGTVSCRVLSVDLLADMETDEVYARIRLCPEGGGFCQEDAAPATQQIEKPASFAKTLTQSDANNGGGFSVPRYCAETIFPRLDYSADPPVQTILAKDVHGHVWKFRHIYRGTPRRHLLTTGWSTFVNQKKLVAGDAIVFLRSASGELCVGVRRSMRGTNGNDNLSWPVGHPRPYSDFLAASDVVAGRPTGLVGSTTSSFARNRARVTAKSVLEAATLAAAGQPFEVIYYPRASTAEFCVRSQAVKTSLNHSWYPGMRFKMAFETEDSSRISWFMGTISAVQPADPIFWPNSPWRLLQVSWDEPDLLQGVSRVSPWQVELVSTVPMQLPPFSLPKKKFRVTQPPESLVNETPQGYFGLPKASLATSVLAQMNPWHNFSNDVPAGMQGARHGKNFGLTLSEYQPSRLRPGLVDGFDTQENKHQFTGGTSDPKLSSFSQYDNKGGQKTLQMLTTSNVNSEAESALSTPPSWTESSTNKCAPFLLFGKAIHPTHAMKEQPQLSGSSSSEGNSCCRSKENSLHTQSSTNSSFVGSHTDTVEQVDGHLHGPKLEAGILKPHQEGRDCNYIDEMGSLKWYKEQVSVIKSEGKEVLGKSSEDSQMHCKIFLESEEIGRTVDLSQFQSYEELYDRLADLFDTDKRKISARVVYRDLEGSTIHVGGELYRNFMQTVRRLTILSEPANGITS